MSGILEGAGFANVELEALDREVVIGGGRDLDTAVQLILQMGPTSAALREAGPAKTDEVTAAVREAMRPYHRPDAGVRMASAAWIVTARRP